MVTPVFQIGRPIPGCVSNFLLKTLAGSDEELKSSVAAPRGGLGAQLGAAPAVSAF